MISDKKKMMTPWECSVCLDDDAVGEEARTGSMSYAGGYGRYADERADAHSRQREREARDRAGGGDAAVEGHEEGRIVGGNVFRSTDPTTSVEEAYGLAALALGRAEDGWSGLKLAVREAVGACAAEMAEMGVTDAEARAIASAAEASASRFEDEDAQRRFALKSVRASLRALPKKREEAADGAPSGAPPAAQAPAADAGAEGGGGGWRPSKKKQDARREAGGGGDEEGPDESSTSDAAFPLSELVMGNMLPDESQEKWRALGVDIRRRQDFLGDRAFARVFGMSKRDFYALAEWKQLSMKKKHDLF